MRLQLYNYCVLRYFQKYLKISKISRRSSLPRIGPHGSVQPYGFTVEQYNCMVELPDTTLVRL